MTNAEFTDQHGLPWKEWFEMSPHERWQYSHETLWPKFLAVGGSLGPEWDPQDPMHDTYIEMGIYEQWDIPPALRESVRQQRASYLSGERRVR